MAVNNFYMSTGPRATELHISNSVNPNKRQNTGILCTNSLRHADRATDDQIVALPICEACQDIFDDIEDGLQDRTG